jgi:hypothetical protein
MLKFEITKSVAKTKPRKLYIKSIGELFLNYIQLEKLWYKFNFSKISYYKIIYVTEGIFCADMQIMLRCKTSHTIQFHSCFMIKIIRGFVGQFNALRTE